MPLQLTVPNQVPPERLKKFLSWVIEAPPAVKAAGGNYWAPHYTYLTSTLLAEAHQLGLKVYVWAVDSRSEMFRLIEMGVDGIITNRPDILKSVVGLP